jgi:hypothetical protein
MQSEDKRTKNSTLHLSQLSSLVSVCFQGYCPVFFYFSMIKTVFLSKSRPLEMPRDCQRRQPQRLPEHAVDDAVVPSWLQDVPDDVTQGYL